jgi:hypothetical protein
VDFDEFGQPQGGEAEGPMLLEASQLGILLEALAR